MGEKVHRHDRAANNPLHPTDPEKSDRLNQLLTSELLKAYGTEKLQLSYLAKLIDLTSNGHIVDILEEQLADIHHHMRRLEKICSLLQLTIPGNIRSKDVIAQLMMKEGKRAAKAVKSYPINSDRVIILEIQKVSHYKMANYMNLSIWAKNLQLGDIGELLEDSLDDIINADLSLSELSESWNYRDIFDQSVHD